MHPYNVTPCWRNSATHAAAPIAAAAHAAHRHTKLAASQANMTAQHAKRHHL